MDEYVTKAVHDEFARRIDEENSRQNHRISNLENGLNQLSELVSQIKVLAVNVENMSKELQKQGTRLETIEAKPEKRWETIVACVITGLVGAAITAVLSGIFH
ncbi:MAG: hypothetical protein IKP31_02340 [Lachnospiraceae bacterium]|nr:hypothetical protein [Lachnospiraceae bacterium]MBR4719062.1 hypothetical protein [Lachnospiraceae bacterium]